MVVVVPRLVLGCDLGQGAFRQLGSLVDETGQLLLDAGELTDLQTNPSTHSPASRFFGRLPRGLLCGAGRSAVLPFALPLGLAGSTGGASAAALRGRPGLAVGLASLSRTDRLELL